MLVTRRTPRAGVLMYHRVADDPCDPWGLSVTPHAFEEHMAFLAHRRAAVDLVDLAGSDATAYSRTGCHVAVTFDDGYADNLDAALPILERHQIPFTIFVIAGTLGRTREFWWDALSRALLFSDALPDTLEIRLAGKDHVFRIVDSPADALAARTWSAEDTEPSSSREHLYLDLWKLLAGLTLTEQDDAVEQILAWSGMTTETTPDRMPATEEQIARLADHPLLTIGSHTMHHRMLTKLPPEAQREEIEGGHRRIAELIGRPIDRFSYPFGRYDNTSSAIVAGLDVALACRSGDRIAGRRSPRLALPRIPVFERDGTAFAAWLGRKYGLLDDQGIAE